MKKVLFIARVVRGHILLFHVPYLKWFKEHGFEVHVCARNDFDNKDECVIPYCDYFHDIPFGRSLIKRENISVYKKLKEIMNENNFELIHTHTPFGGALGRLAAIHSRKNYNTKVIYTAHGFHFHKTSSLLSWLVYFPLEWILAWMTDVLITINQEDYKLALKYFRAKEVVYVHGIGFNPENFSKSNLNKSHLGLKEDTLLLLSVGELNDNKNHSLIIQALSELQIDNYLYLIAGVGVNKDALEKMIIEKNMVDRIKLIGFRNDIKDIISISDIFIFPSKREGLSVALMEAMYVNLPIICSKIRGNTDLLQNYDHATLIDGHQVDDYKKAIIKTINTMKLNQLKSSNNESLEAFMLDNVIKEYEKIYLSLLK